MAYDFIWIYFCHATTVSIDLFCLVWIFACDFFYLFICFTFFILIFVYLFILFFHDFPIILNSQQFYYFVILILFSLFSFILHLLLATFYP